MSPHIYVLHHILKKIYTFRVSRGGSQFPGPSFINSSDDLCYDSIERYMKLKVNERTEVCECVPRESAADIHSSLYIYILFFLTESKNIKT